MDDRSAMQVQLGDEAEFVKFAEYFVYRMQALWRTKEGLPFEAFIDIADKVEEQVYKKALIENHPVPQDLVWFKKEAILWYQDRCKKILRNLEFGEADWKKVYDENRGNAQSMYTMLLREDIGADKKKRPSAKSRKSEGDLGVLHVEGTGIGSKDVGAKRARRGGGSLGGRGGRGGAKASSTRGVAPSISVPSMSTISSSTSFAGLGLSSVSLSQMGMDIDAPPDMFQGDGINMKREESAPVDLDAVSWDKWTQSSSTISQPSSSSSSIGLSLSSADLQDADVLQARREKEEEDRRRALILESSTASTISLDERERTRQQLNNMQRTITVDNRAAMEELESFWM